MLRAVATKSGPVTLAQSAVASSVTGTLSETVLASVTIPGGMMGPNGALRVTATWSYTNSANTKRPIVNFGGVQFQSIPFSTVASSETERTIRNRGATNSQVCVGLAATGFSSTSSATITSSIDTRVDQVLTLSGTLANITETITLEGYTVEVLSA